MGHNSCIFRAFKIRSGNIDRSSLQPQDALRGYHFDYAEELKSGRPLMSRERTFLVPIIFCFLDSLFLWGPRVGVFHASDRVRGANGCRRVDPRSKQLLIAQAFLSISCVRSGLATSVTHSNPYLTVGLDRREASRDCDTNESIACHAVGLIVALVTVHSFREFSPQFLREAQLV